MDASVWPKAPRLLMNHTRLEQPRACTHCILEDVIVRWHFVRHYAALLCLRRGATWQFARLFFFLHRACAAWQCLTIDVSWPSLAPPPKANDVADVSDCTKSWRKGIMHAVQSNLYDAELAELMEHYIYTTRPLPGTIFICLWKCLLDYLQWQQEERCVNVLLKTFLEKDGNGAIVAVWRCGVDRMIFATATASQAQEAWNYHRLRPGLGER